VAKKQIDDITPLEHKRGRVTVRSKGFLCLGKEQQ